MQVTIEIIAEQEVTQMKCFQILLSILTQEYYTTHTPSDITHPTGPAPQSTSLILAPVVRACTEISLRGSPPPTLACRAPPKPWNAPDPCPLPFAETMSGLCDPGRSADETPKTFFSLAKRSSTVAVSSSNANELGLGPSDFLAAARAGIDSGLAGERRGEVGNSRFDGAMMSSGHGLRPRAQLTRQVGILTRV